MTTASSFHERVLDAASIANDLARGTPLEERAARVVVRLQGPLRLAIAGRAKAGKSTLLNALVGDRLAPTDESECTRIVSWYQYGIRYDVHALLRDGSSVSVPFTREDGGLRTALHVPEDEVVRLEVSWPASRLRDLTLIDTPGLESTDDRAAQRTRALLTRSRGGESEADAVVYLMRHLHRRDAEFLEAFVDRSLADTSPVNAVAVLSRADEIGVGRLDALDSAARVAQRYAENEELRTVVATVLPVAGLIAETARTLRESEAAELSAIAAQDPATLDDLLLSVDRFRDSTNTAVPTAQRHALLKRFGLFGVRYSVALARRGELRNATSLAQHLEQTSRIGELTALLDGHFVARSRALQARAALATLANIALDLADRDATNGARLQRLVDEIEASSHELAELRLAHMLMSNALQLASDERAELERLTTPGTAAARLDLRGSASAEAVRSAALTATERWRTRAAHPLRDRLSTEAFETAARLCEGLYAAAEQRP